MSGYQRQDKGFWYHEEYDPIRNGSMDGTDIRPHDRGLKRAYRFHFDSTKDPSVDCDPYKTLFVGRLKYETTEETIRQTFSRYGRLQSVHLVRDLVTGCSRGYCFVEYAHEEDFVSAFYAAHRTYIDGAQILVDFMRAQTVPGWVPRRLGGGVGGKKQSGQMRFGGRDCPFHAPYDSNRFLKKVSRMDGVESQERRSTPLDGKRMKESNNRQREPYKSREEPYSNQRESNYKQEISDNSNKDSRYKHKDYDYKQKEGCSYGNNHGDYSREKYENRNGRSHSQHRHSNSRHHRERSRSHKKERSRHHHRERSR